MSELNTLRPVLQSIPIDEVSAPDLPMAVALQEAVDLHAALEADDGWSRLVAVSLDPAVNTELPIAIGAARQAQSQWMVIRDRSKPEAQREREERGTALRRELMAACHWNLRDDARARGVLDAIAQGDGLPDLVQDLLDLAQLVTDHLPQFESDQTFDAPVQIAAARSLASEIAEGVAGRRADGDQREAKQLRDRAYTHLDRMMSDIRNAGRYAFRGEPRRLSIFNSRYLQRRRRAARRRDEAIATTRAKAVVPTS